MDIVAEMNSLAEYLRTPRLPVIGPPQETDLRYALDAEFASLEIKALRERLTERTAVVELDKQEIASLRSERDAESAMRRSAEEKLKRAGEVTKILFGVDTPDAMADEILTLRSERDALREALRECADDIEAEVRHKYGASMDQPIVKRRFERDMDIVRRARSLLSPARKEE